MSFVVAFEFLTCLRFPLPRRDQEVRVGRSLRWFPLVGALIGCAVGLIDSLLGRVTTPEIRAVLAVGLLAAITGGLHLDGLMDSCDGLFVFAPAERRLQIMRDSHVGSFAIVGLVTDLLLKYSALLVVPEPVRLPTFVAMGALSRWAMVLATVHYPSARADGLGRAYKSSANARELVIATPLALLALAPLRLAGLGLIAVAFAATVFTARLVMRRIPGLTGDTYGAISEIVEIAVAIAVPPLLVAVPMWGP
ncbi:MAG: adenosylcobinamide-GDP ribazoletransferase [Chloroflexota bacterium]|jgi:adenosylcobinamide-GDP ribazoletransferase|nr:adenosylcobinamide-GDP ribazoletransferase [Chloroflexota bacterium]